MPMGNYYNSVSEMTGYAVKEISYSASEGTSVFPALVDVCIMLRKLGLYEGNDITEYNINLSESVMAFQSKYGIPPSGTLNDRTLRMLIKQSELYISDNLGGDGYEDNNSNINSDSYSQYPGAHHGKFFDERNQKPFRQNRSDIKILFGDGTITKTIKDVHMRSSTVEVDASGNPIYEVYEFIARDIVETDEPMDAAKYLYDEDYAGADYETTQFRFAGIDYSNIAATNSTSTTNAMAGDPRFKSPSGTGTTTTNTVREESGETEGGSYTEPSVGDDDMKKVAESTNSANDTQTGATTTGSGDSGYGTNNRNLEYNTRTEGNTLIRELVSMEDVQPGDLVRTKVIGGNEALMLRYIAGRLPDGTLVTNKVVGQSFKHEQTYYRINEDGSVTTIETVAERNQRLKMERNNQVYVTMPDGSTQVKAIGEKVKVYDMDCVVNSDGKLINTVNDTEWDWKMPKAGETYENGTMLHVIMPDGTTDYKNVGTTFRFTFNGTKYYVNNQGHVVRYQEITN